MLTAGLTFGMLAGCGGEEKKTYDQACADLAQGSYDYALEGYQSSMLNGYKSCPSLIGGRYRKPASWKLSGCHRIV